MKKKRLIILLVVILLIAVPIVVRIVNLDDNTTYIPFSGRIFDFEAQDVSDLFIQSGRTGDNTTEADAEAVTEALNSLRSWFWFPELKLFETGGWEYRAALVDGNVQKSFYFNDAPIPYISVNGIVYILSGEQVAVLTDFVD